MKSSLKPLMRQSGFTLVELMVVVAIIGLLSAVAIPNFKKYQSKSKVSEAKLQLSAAYTAEQSFFSDFNLYHTCLPYMGFDPGQETANRYYAIGFGSATVTIDASAYAAAVNSGLDSTANGCPIATTTTQGSTVAGTRSANNSTWFAAGKGTGGVIASATGWMAGAAIGTQASTSTMIFTIAAGGAISGDFGTADSSSLLDINHNKILRNVRNGY